MFERDRRRDRRLAGPVPRDELVARTRWVDTRREQEGKSALAVPGDDSRLKPEGDERQYLSLGRRPEVAVLLPRCARLHAEGRRQSERVERREIPG